MRKLLAAATLALVLSGCKTTEPLYYHGEYNTAVYSYFKGDDTTIDEQIMAMNQLIEKASAANRPVAPGVPAHLGMLYFESGNADLGRQHFLTEKSLFPESSQYIDFMLKSAEGA